MLFKASLVLFVVVAISTVGLGVYALDRTKPEGEFTAPVAVSDPVENVGTLERSKKPRNAWVEPRREVPEPEPQAMIEEASPSEPEEPAPEELAPKPVVGTTTLVNVEACGGESVQLNIAEKRMLELHNQTRKERGLGVLCASRDLTHAARAHSQDMLARDYFEHNTPEGLTPKDRTSDLGRNPVDGRSYDMGNENIALGGGPTATPENRFTGFMNSPGHRAGILTPEFSEVGVAALTGEYKGIEGAVIYTVNFGGWRGG